MRLETMQYLDKIIETNIDSRAGTRARALRDRAMRTQNAVTVYRQTAPKLPGAVGKTISR